MEINWIIIGIVVATLLVLIVYLVKQNQKDQQKVTRHFNADTTELSEEEDELNNN